jgi:putative acetyltransferase
MEIRRVTSEDPAFIALTDELTQFLAVVNDICDTQEFFTHQNRTSTMPYCLVIDDLACGALRPKDETTIEIKRMYTRPEARGTGYAHAVLEALETWAKELGFTSAVLETSVRLEAANRLYERAGYLRIPNFPPYENVEDSVCFRKELQ